MTTTSIEIQPRDKSVHQVRVESFMKLAKQEVPDTVVIPDEKVRLLRARLIMEEAMETILALGIDMEVDYPSISKEGLPITKNRVRFIVNEARGCDLIEVADGCADISVVTVGTLSAFGIADYSLLAEVDRSNLDKFRGDAHKDEETGKWVKPTDWVAPRIEQILEEQRAAAADVSKILYQGAT